jgi:hypothetical protein
MGAEVKFFGRPPGAVDEYTNRPAPSDDDLPKVPQPRKYIVEFMDGTVFEIWAHYKELSYGVVYFTKVTGFRWAQNGWLNRETHWKPRANKIIVAEIPTTAYKMIRQG